jgi:hypothetical protein
MKRGKRSLFSTDTFEPEPSLIPAASALVRKVSTNASFIGRIIGVPTGHTKGGIRGSANENKHVALGRTFLPLICAPLYIQISSDPN